MDTTTAKRAYRFRFYPTPEQEQTLRRTLGCCRKVYNMALDARSEAWTVRHESVSYEDTSRMLTDWKKTKEYAYLREVSSVPLQQSLRHCRRVQELLRQDGRLSPVQIQEERRSRHLCRIRVHLGLGQTGIDFGEDARTPSHPLVAHTAEESPAVHRHRVPGPVRTLAREHPRRRGSETSTRLPKQGRRRFGHRTLRHPQHRGENSPTHATSTVTRRSLNKPNKLSPESRKEATTIAKPV